MKDLIRDKRGSVPIYVITNDEDGKAIVLNQFTGRAETIGERPFSTKELRAAMARIYRADKEQEDGRGPN